MGKVKIDNEHHQDEVQKKFQKFDVYLPTLKGKKKTQNLLNVKTLNLRILDFVYLNNVKLFEEWLIDLENGGVGEPIKRNIFFSSNTNLDQLRRRKSFALDISDSKEFFKQFAKQSAVHNSRLHPNSNPMMTNGNQNEEDLGFSKPNEEDKYEESKFKNQPLSGDSNSESKSESSDKIEQNEVYDNDLKRKLRYEHIITL